MILDGRGSTRVWNEAGQTVSFEWQAGALFSIPLNTWHQHFNGSGQDTVRFVAVTNMPPIMNVFEEPEFIFSTAYDFKSRFSGEPDYFAPKEEVSGLLLETNFVADAVNLPLIEAKERGAGGGHIRFNLAKSSMNSHISAFPAGKYKKAHAHGPGAHVITLAGEGYTLMWPEGEEPKRYDWKPGTMITPPIMWYHQHFNTGAEAARYLAFKYEGVAIRSSQGVPKAWVSRRIGGHQSIMPMKNLKCGRCSRMPWPQRASSRRCRTPTKRKRRHYPQSHDVQATVGRFSGIGTLSIETE